MPVTVSCRTPDGLPWRSYLRLRARHLLSALGLGGSELSLLLVGDGEMRMLNRRYRGRDRATDVLSFPLHELVPGASLPADAGAVPAARLLGDVVISIDTARRQARTSRRPLAWRLEALLIHGVLHLLGFDHEVSPVEARRMERKARALRATLSAVPAQLPPKGTVAAGPGRSENPSRGCGGREGCRRGRRRGGWRGKPAGARRGRRV